MKISAGILAGGEGRRFGGADKGWLTFEGKPLVEHVLDALRPQADEILISANRNLARYAGLGVRVVTDEIRDSREGPFAGIVRLLAVAGHPWLLCVPCDALRLPPDFAARMLEHATRSGAEIAVLDDGARVHPVFCMVQTALAGEAARAFDAGERSPRRWFESRRIAHYHGFPPLNLNTPDDLAAVESGT